MTKAYGELHASFREVVELIKLENTVKLIPERDPSEVASYEDGEDMPIVLEMYDKHGVVVVHDMCTEELAREHIWFTVIHVICAQVSLSHAFL